MEKILFIAFEGGRFCSVAHQSYNRTFEALAVIGDPVTEDDEVVHLIASLNNSFNMLVIALKANVDVPEKEVERLLNEKRKISNNDDRNTVNPLR